MATPCDRNGLLTFACKSQGSHQLEQVNYFLGVKDRTCPLRPCPPRPQRHSFKSEWRTLVGDPKSKLILFLFP